ncbi:MAG: YqgE/AlgH family protein [Betaproteobacteria bacterium]|nr:MAG: YqgE/AlgH family protein [Betaproteobacteria bacterium]
MKIRILLVALVLATAAPLAFATDVTQTVLLVAKRNLRDRLYGSTILVARPIGDERHVGFIVNKPTNLTLGKLFPKHTPSQKVIDPVYLGGPTGPEVIFAMIKGRDSPGGRSLQLAPGLFVAFDSSIVDRIIETQPQQARFFAGMVLWAPNELDEEIRRGLWYTLEPQPDLFLRKSTDGLWEDLVNRSERRANTI